VYQGATDQRHETSLSTVLVLGLAKYIYDKLKVTTSFSTIIFPVLTWQKSSRSTTLIAVAAWSNRRRYPPTGGGLNPTR
jgi:formylmethanofuran dehydrogenase subunit D